MKARVRGLFRAKGGDKGARSSGKVLAEMDGYELGPTLGIGGYARVILGVKKDSREKVALKLLLADKSGRISDSKRRQTDRAIDLLGKVSHAHVLRLVSYNKEAMYPDGTACMLMALEHAPNGELFDYLMFTGSFDEEVSRSFFHQLIAGLEAIHTAGFAHRDLKPENLLLAADFSLKIADFGFATTFVSEDDPSSLVKMKTACGTKGYLAPEVLRGEKYLQSVDIFAAGIILFIMYAGFPPFNDAIPTDWWWARLEAGWKERALGGGKVVDKKGDWSKHGLFWAAHERTRSFPVDLKDFLLKMMHYDPEERPTIPQLREEPWSYYQSPPRVYGKKERDQKKKDVAYIRAHTTKFTADDGRTVVDGPSWYNGKQLVQEELAAYLSERVDTVRKESAKKVAEQQAELETVKTRAGEPADILVELDRTKLEYQLAIGMEGIAEEIDPSGKLDECCEVLSDDTVSVATPYYFYTRLPPRLSFATFQFVAKQLDEECDISINFDSVQMLVDTKVTLPPPADIDDDELPPPTVLPSTIAIVQYKIADSDDLYVVMMKRVNGDPLTFKRVMDAYLGEPNIQKLRYIREAELPKTEADDDEKDAA
jgi:serine/threonine protein kinase